MVCSVDAREKGTHGRLRAVVQLEVGVDARGRGEDVVTILITPSTCAPVFLQTEE